MRLMLSALLWLLALLFVWISATMPFMLPAQAAKDRAYYERFKAAAIVIDREKRVPPEAVLSTFQTKQSYPFISVSTEVPFDCDSSFKKAPTDRIVLSFWRSEWTECYAHPSGRTTLGMTVQGYLKSGLAVQIVAYWLIAAGAAWGANRLGRKRGAPDDLASIGS